MGWSRFSTLSASLSWTRTASVAAQIVKKYYAPALAHQKLPQDQEPDVVTIKLRPEKVVAVVEAIAREAACSWSSCP